MNGSVMFASFHRLCCRLRLPGTGQLNVNNCSARTGTRSVALTSEHLERCHDCAARYAQFGCQSAGGRQASPGSKPPRQNFGANPLINLAIKEIALARPNGVVISLHGPLKFTNLGPLV